MVIVHSYVSLPEGTKLWFPLGLFVLTGMCTPFLGRSVGWAGYWAGYG